MLLFLGVMALQLTGCVTLGKYPNVSELWDLQQLDGGKYNSPVGFLGKLNLIFHVKCSGQHATHNEVNDGAHSLCWKTKIKK